MFDIFENAKVETSADTKEKVIRALGFDEPPVGEKLERSAFPSDEAYFDAVARLSVQQNSPEYREAYRAIRKQYTAEQRAAEEAAAEQKHQAELAQAIKDCVLRPEEQKKVDDEARARAQVDLAAGRISFQQLGETVAQYCDSLTEEAKKTKVHTADFNAQLRAAMKSARTGVDLFRK